MNLVKSLLGLALGKRLPRHSGRIAVSGLEQTVQIHRDEHGIPFIEAQSNVDVWFGLGFCHGQDRGGQLEVLTRVIRGRLAEAIGPDGLAVDRLTRRIGARPAAEGQLAVAQPRVRQQLRAYALGVNQGLTRGARRRAHELALLRTRPTPWEAADAQAVITFLCFALAANWDIELVRLRMLEADGAGALAALDPSYPGDLPVTSPPGEPFGEGLDRLSADVQALTALIGSAGASNAWVVSGDKTQSGRPILANDPHLNPTAPPQWYLAHLSTPEWSAAGATHVGIPAIAAGHNGFAGWGLTAAHADNCDLFIEELRDDGLSVRQGDKWVACHVRTEVIRVRGREPVVEHVLITPRGPIISPAIEGERRVLSMAATWLQPRPYEGFLGIHKVRSPADFRAVFAENSTSAVSVVYADVEGHIAWQMASALPQRKKGYGTIPLPGWETDVGWQQEGLPHESTPFLVDPEAGYICTANNPPIGPGSGPHLGVDWLDGYRQAAIAEALSAGRDWDIQKSAALQQDTRSLPWRTMRSAVLAVPAERPAVAQAVRILREWDGRLSADSTGASVYALFVAEMCRRVVHEKSPKAAAWALGRGFSRLLPYNLLVTRRLGHLVGLLRDQPEGFFERGWPTQMAGALAQAVQRLSQVAGDSSGWAWGRVRPLWLRHPFGERAPLYRLFNLGPYPGWGDASTIAQGAVDLEDPLNNPLGLATLRMVLDVGAWDDSRFVWLGGQSGNPFSVHYDDMIAPWFRGAAVAIAWSETARRKCRRQTLELSPEEAGP